MQILVMSCDKNRDLFYPFFHCMEKYWPNHPQINYSTETIRNPYYKTYSANYSLEQWTRRVRDTVKLIKDDRIMLICDDFFIRNTPDIDTIEKRLLPEIKNNVAAVSFELSFDKNDLPYNDILLKRSPNGAYKTSVAGQIWNKDKLMRVFDCDLDPWHFEYANRHNNYDYLILKDKLVIDWGHHRYGDKWGVYRNLWGRDTVRFLTEEGLTIDFNQRGIYKE